MVSDKKENAYTDDLQMLHRGGNDCLEILKSIT